MDRLPLSPGVRRRKATNEVMCTVDKAEGGKASTPAGAWPAARVLDDSGSTTSLLEHLTGTPVSLRVLEQLMVARDMIPRHARMALDVHVEERLLLRRSALLDGHGRTLSMNYVVARVEEDKVIARITMSDCTPIGHGLASQGVRHRRELIRFGWEDWVEQGSGARCACREYLILIDQRSVIFIHEAFNPELFLLGDTPTGLCKTLFEEVQADSGPE